MSIATHCLKFARKCGKVSIKGGDAVLTIGGHVTDDTVSFQEKGVPDAFVSELEELVVGRSYPGTAATEETPAANAR